MSDKEKRIAASNGGEIHIEPTILVAPLKYKAALCIWVPSEISFPCFDDQDIILPFIRSFYPATASIKSVICHESIVAYQVDVPGWLSIPLCTWERREFRPARYEYKRKE